MIQIGEKYKVEITDISQDGEGIGRIDGIAVFVNDAVIGDKCTVEITKLKKNYAFAKLFEIDEPSTYRIVSNCEHSADCGGCSLATLSYEGQLMFKQKKVKAVLQRIGGIDNPNILPIIGMENPLYYRNNGQFPVGGTSKDPKIGFYKARTHYVEDCRDCLLQSEPAVTVAQVIREYIKEYDVSIYNEKTGKGTLRHVIVRNAEGTGEVMVILVINQGKVSAQEELTEWIAEALEDLDSKENDGIKWKLRSLVFNINKAKGGSILGDKNIFIYGQERICDKFLGTEYLISPNSFYQVNSKQAAKLYSVVKDFADLTGEETIFDLYCGVGTISLYLAPYAKRVIGIEVVKSAVLDANRNAIKNEIVNAVFTCGKAEEALPEMVLKGTRANIAVLDPPRSGCDERTINAVADAGVDKIIYVSCNPATMARDVKIMIKMGYILEKVQPVDMFPWTVHIEGVALLTKSEAMR